MSAQGQKMSPSKGKTMIMVASVALEVYMLILLLLCSLFICNVIIIYITLQKADWKLSHALCSQLMEAQFAEAWEICRLVLQFEDEILFSNNIAFYNNELLYSR